MDAVASVPAPATKKVKPGRPKLAVKKVSNHPSYQEMIKKAVETLKERNGSSRQAIQKYIQATFKTCDDKLSQAHLKLALKRGVEVGTLKRVKGAGASGSFRLAQKVAKPVKAVKVVKKPKTPKKAAKSAKAAKPAKAAGEKKAAKPKVVKAKAPAKPKKAVAEKKASKPKVAKKPKTPKKAVKPVAKKAAPPKAKKPAAKKAPAKK